MSSVPDDRFGFSDVRSIDVDITPGDGLAIDRKSSILEYRYIAVLADLHLWYPHGLADLGVGDHMPEFTVDRDESLGTDRVVERLEFLSSGVP